MKLPSVRMNFALLCWLLVLYATSVSSATITTPPMQRKSIGESCQFHWKVTGNFSAYTVKLLSSSTALGANSNVSSINGVITLLIWNIQTSNAGYYTLSITSDPATDGNSIVLLFVYYTPSASAVLSVGRNPGYEGDAIELNCSATSNSMPVSDRPKLYYFWYIASYGNLRNISSGPAFLQNGDVVPGYSIKNDGKTLVIASVQYTDSYSCTVREERSPYKSINYNTLSITINARPFSYSFYPASRRLNIPLYSSVQSLFFYYRAYPALTSYTNWSFVNASGSILEYTGNNPLTTSYAEMSSFPLNSVNQYGNYSIILTNSYGSRTTTFQVLPPGPPDTPSNFSVQYLTSSRISLQWRCMWFNGAQQTVIVQLKDAATNIELETQYFRSLVQTCYNSLSVTLFQRSIQPEMSYEASIWSTNSLGSSAIAKLVLRTPKRVILSVSPSNILIDDRQATINFLVLDSATTLIRLNVTCCVEITAECSNKSYILSNTDNQILYDILPTGTEYVFDFIVFDTDGYTYEYNLAVVKGVRVSTGVTTPSICITYSRQCAFNGTIPVDSGNPLFVPVIVLAILLGVAVLVLVGCCIGFLVCKYRQNNSGQLTKIPRTSAPTRNNTVNSESPYVEDNYEPMVDVDRTKDNVYYKSLGGTPDNAKQFSEELYEQTPELGNEDDSKQNPYMNPNEIFHTSLNETMDRPERNRYK